MFLIRHGFVPRLSEAFLAGVHNGGEFLSWLGGCLPELLAECVVLGRPNP